MFKNIVRRSFKFPEVNSYKIEPLRWLVASISKGKERFCSLLRRTYVEHVMHSHNQLLIFLCTIYVGYALDGLCISTIPHIVTLAWL